MQGSTATDTDGIVSSNRSPNLVGFVDVITSGTEYILSANPTDSLTRSRLQRIHAVCTDPTGSVGGVWELYDATGAGQSLIMSLPQPSLAAGLAAGQTIIFDFPTSLSSKPGKTIAPMGNIVIKPTSNLGSWKIAALGYYTKTPPNTP